MLDRQSVVAEMEPDDSTPWFDASDIILRHPSSLLAAVTSNPHR